MGKKKKLNNWNKKENVYSSGGAFVLFCKEHVECMNMIWKNEQKGKTKCRHHVHVWICISVSYELWSPKERESEGDRRESWKQILQMIIDNNFSAFPFKCPLSLFSYSNKRKDFYINEWMNDILNEMNMIRVGEIHGPWLLVRSRVGVYIYVTCCCVGSTQFFICLELKLHWLAVGFGQHV